MNTNEPRFVPLTVKTAALLCVVLFGVSMASYFVEGPRLSRPIGSRVVSALLTTWLWFSAARGLLMLSSSVWKVLVFLMSLSMLGAAYVGYLLVTSDMSQLPGPVALSLIGASTSVVLLILLLLPSSRQAFRIGRFKRI